MFKLNQIDNNHIQFSMSVYDSKFDSETLIDAVHDYINSNNEKYGYFGESTSLHEVSHQVENINVDEENGWIYGTLKVLDTPNGKRIQEFLNHNLVQYLQLNIHGYGHYDSEGEKQKVDNILSINFINP